MTFDTAGLDDLLERLDPGRDARAAGLRPPASEADLAGLPPDLQALWRWHDGQDRDAAVACPPADELAAPRILVRRFGITRRLRPQGRLLAVAEARALARPGFIPVFEHPVAPGEEPAWVGRRDDGLLVYSFGPRAEPGRGGLQAWRRSLEAAHRALYMIDVDHFERAQRWVMAACALVGASWGAATDTFGMVLAPERGAEVARALHDDWGIWSPESARERIAALRLEERPTAWSLMRASAVAGWSYRAGYLPLAEAWEHAVGAARELRRTHGSWGEVGARALAEAEAEDVVDDAAREALGWLETAPCSPWRLLSWDTPLPAALPPPDEPEVPDVHVVATPDELGAALFEAGPRSIVRLRAGLYRGAFEPRTAGLTIEAEAGAAVVIEGVGERPALRVASGGARLVGIVFAPAGEGVRVTAPYLHVDGCAFEGGSGDAIVAAPARHVAGDGGPIVHVERTTLVEPGGSAVVVSEGLVIASDVEVIAPGAYGVVARGGTGSALARVQVTRPGRDGVRLEGGRHALVRVGVEAAGRCGLAVHARAEVVVTSSVFAGSEVANVELGTVGPSAIAHCRLDGGRRFGAWLHPGHGARLVATAIGGSRLAAIQVEGGRDVAVSDADLGPSHEGGGVVAVQGGHVITLDTRVRGIAGAALEADAGRVEARGIAVTDVAVGVRARAGGRVAARDVTCRRVRSAALEVEVGGHAAIELLVVDALAEVGRIVDARPGAVALLGTVVAPDGEARVHVAAGARVAVARGLGADRAAVEPGGVFAGAPSPEGGTRVGAPSVGGGRSASTLALTPEVLAAWGVAAEPELLARVVARVAEDAGALGIAARVDPRTARVVVEGDAAEVARIEPRVRSAAVSEGEVGRALATIVFEDEPEDEEASAGDDACGDVVEPPA